MKQPIKVLIVEDSENDAALLIRTLQRGGYEPVYEIVETPEAMADALDRQLWDLVISDYLMPCFSGLDALKLLQEKDPDLSFILMTDQVGEETAVEVMRAGAHDYILKSNRARLIPAVERELRDTRVRRANRQNEQALRESQERYHLIVETANEGVWQYDEERRITFVNQKMAEMLGYSIEEMMGQSLLSFVHEEWRKALEANIILRSRRERRGQIEYRYLRKDGTDLWAIVNAFPIFRDDGSYAGAIGLHIDITERKQAEKELRESEERFRLLFDGSQDAIMTIAPPSWKFNSANPATLKMFRAKDAAEIAILGPWGASPERQPDGRFSADKANEMIEIALREGSHFFEWTHRRLDGAVFPANVLLTRVEIAGQVLIQATVRDITAQKQAEDALRESEEKYRHLIENSHDIIYTLNPDGVYTFVSPAWTTLLGHPVDQVVGQPFQSFIHADDVVVCLDYLRTVIGTGRRQANIECRVRHADGSWRWNTTNGGPLRDRAGTIVGFEGIARDITERKRAEEALRASEEKYRVIFSATGIPATITEEDNTISLVNSEFEIMSGFSKAEIEGRKSWQEFYTEDALASMARYHKLRRVDPDAAPKQYEAEFITRSGDVKQVIVTVSMIPGTKLSSAFFLDISAIRQAEKAVKQSEEKFRTLFEEAPIGIDISRAGKILMANQAYLDMFGYASFAELEGKPLLDQVAPQCRSQIKEIVANREQGKESPSTLETVGLRKDGSRFPFDIFAACIKLQDGPATIGYFSDITERKLGEEALKQSEEKYRSLVENLNDVIYAIDANGYCTFISSAIERMTGYSAEEYIGKLFVSYFHPEDKPGSLEQFRLTIGGQVEPAELRTLKKDGTYVYIRSLLRVVDENGQLSLVGVLYDVTELKQVEDKLRQRAAELQAVFQALPDLFLRLGADSTILELLPGSPDDLYMTPEELFGKRIQDIFEPLSQQFQQAIDQVLQTRSLVIMEYPLTLKGELKFFEARCFPLLEDQVIMVVRNITERKRTEDDLEKHREHLEELVAERTMGLLAVNQELEAFTRSVSHDLRAPLRRIQGFSKILLDDYAGRLDKQGSEYLERLKASSQHMSQLIEDLLNLSRVTSAALDREQTDLSAMVQTIAADLINQQPDRQAHFDIQEGITVFGDPNLLSIMLQNLLDNAWKFTGKKAAAEISFGITIYEGRQAYYVRDNGAGFDIAKGGKLFEPFKRLHSAKEFTGTGIGLASVKRIIRRHGGQIWAEGEVGKGAAFYFTL
ncbi:MAG: PAS domain S-box protein [Thermacetogeniaceae bacterium]